MNFDSFALEVSADNLLRDTENIAEYERLSGSEEELKAFRYLEKKYREYGAHTRLTFHDAYISLPLESSLVINGEQFECRAPSMSKATPAEGLRGSVLYVDDLNLLTEEKCREKIVIIKGRATYNNIRAAEKAKAAAVVCVQQDRINECIASNAWGSPSIHTNRLIPDIVSVSIDDRSFSKIMKNGCPLEACLVVNMDTGWRKIPLLEAEVKASSVTEQFVMFSGHVDSWYYGAMDNATVNALQLEVIRIAAKNAERLERNLRVVNFSGHSHGRYAGSAWYSDNYWLELYRNCVINVNADSIGAKGAEKITRSMIMPETMDLAVRIIKEQTGVDFEGERCSRKADQSFWINGVSSAFASFSRQKKAEVTGNDLGWWWHTPEDTFDKIELEYLLRDARIFTSYIMSFLTQEVIPLNFCATILEIEASLLYYQKQLAERFSLLNTLDMTSKAKSLCKKAYAKKVSDTASFNQFLLKLGRMLVHINYTTGNIYENESGGGGAKMPALAIVSALLKTAVGSDAEMEHIVELRHKVNFIEHQLYNAIELLDSYLRNDR